MTMFQMIIGTAAVMQVLLLAMVSHTLLDIKLRLDRRSH